MAESRDAATVIAEVVGHYNGEYDGSWQPILLAKDILAALSPDGGPVAIIDGQIVPLEALDLTIGGVPVYVPVMGEPE